MRYKEHNILCLRHSDSAEVLVEVMTADEENDLYVVRNIEGEILRIKEPDLDSMAYDINMTESLLHGLKFETQNGPGDSKIFIKYLVDDRTYQGYQIVVEKRDTDYFYCYNDCGGVEHCSPIGAYPDLQNKVFETLGFHMPLSLKRIAMALGKKEPEEWLYLLDDLFEKTVILDKAQRQLQTCRLVDVPLMTKEYEKKKEDFIAICRHIKELHESANDENIEALWNTMNQINPQHFGTYN